MSVPLTEMESKFFDSHGTDEGAVTKMRETIPEPAPVIEDVSHETSVETKVDKPAVTTTVTEEKPIAEVKFVPLEALQEERAEKKELKAQLQQFQAWQAQVQERLKFLPANEQAQAPDPNTDPFGYQNWALQQLGGSVQEINKWRQEQQQQAQAQNQTQQTLNWASQQASAFAAKQPDYPDAYRFASEARDKEYQAMGITDPNMRQQLIEQDTARVINHAAQNSLNPAELIFNFAKVRGWAGKTAIPAQAALDPNAQAKIAAGQDATQKLNKGGQTSDGEMTANDLSRINDPVEFEKAWAKMFKK